MKEKWRKASTMPLHEDVIVCSRRGIERVAKGVKRRKDGLVRCASDGASGYHHSDLIAVKWKPLESNADTKSQPEKQISDFFKGLKMPIMEQSEEKKIDFMDIQEIKDVEKHHVHFIERPETPQTVIITPSQTALRIIYAVLILVACVFGALLGNIVMMLSKGI